MQTNENLAIMITDIAGYTERMSTRSRQEMQRLLEWHDATLREVIEFYEGQWIKSTGDGVLAVFRSPTNAVQCGMAIQDALAEYNYQREESDELHVRIALNVGEVRWVGGSDISGEAVNLAARIESETPVDEVWFSDAMYLVMNKAEVPSEKVGERTFKGIPEPVRIYRVPSGEAMRLVGTGEPMQIEGVPYPFGGMPRPRHGDAGPPPEPAAPASDAPPREPVGGGQAATGKGLGTGAKVGIGAGVAAILLAAVLLGGGESDEPFPVPDAMDEPYSDPAAFQDPPPEIPEPAPAPQPAPTPAPVPQPAPQPAPAPAARGLSIGALQGGWVNEEDGEQLLIQGNQYQLYEFGMLSDAGALSIQGDMIYAHSMSDGMTYPFRAEIQGDLLMIWSPEDGQSVYRRVR